MASPTNPETYTTPLVPASSASLIVHASYTCSAPAALVFRTLRNTETWKDWNRFCPRVTIRHQPDDSDELEEMEYYAVSGGFASPAAASDAIRRKSIEVRELEQARHASLASSTGSGKVENAMRRASHVSRRQLHAAGGEPSARLKDGTKCTFHVRMKLPEKQADYTDATLVVTEVSRPNDPANDDYSTLDAAQLAAAGAGLGLSAVQTHTDAGASGVYRIVWASDPPKSRTLLAQRVHEIRPLPPAEDGAGVEAERCEIVTWECQRGILARVVKRMSGRYIQERFEEWVKGLGEYCEAMAGSRVERHDFGVPSS